MMSCGLIAFTARPRAKRSLTVLVGHVIERAVRLDVHQAHPERIGDASQRLNLLAHRSFDLRSRELQFDPSEIRAVGIAGMRARRDIQPFTPPPASRASYARRLRVRHRRHSPT